MKFHRRRTMLLLVQLTFAMIGSVTQCAPASLNFERNIWNVSNPNSSNITQLVDQSHGPINIKIFVSSNNSEHGHHHGDNSGRSSDEKHTVINSTSVRSSSTSENGVQIIRKALSLAQIKVELLLITNNNDTKQSEVGTISLPMEFHVNIVVPSSPPTPTSTESKDDDQHQMNAEPKVFKKNKVSLMLPPLPIQPEEQSNEPNMYYPSSSILRPQKMFMVDEQVDHDHNKNNNNHQKYVSTTAKTPGKTGVGQQPSTISFPDSAEDEVQTGTIPLKWLLQFFRNVRNNVTSLKFLSSPELEVRDLQKIIQREFLLDVTKRKVTE